MDTYAVRPVFAGPFSYFDLTLDVPGSKSITNRALMLAALADGKSRLEGVLFSDDSRHFLDCLKDLGFDLEIDEAERTVSVTGLGGRLPLREASVNVGSAGTAARFLTAMLGFAPGIWHLDASEQMRRRPMGPLLKTLRTLGVTVRCEGEEDHFPFTLISEGISADSATINIDDSSQFLSAMLMASVMSGRPFAVTMTGSHGFAYVRMTMEMMRQFGVPVDMPEPGRCIVDGRKILKAASYRIEPDVSAACYFYGAAAISGGSICVRGVQEDSLQGDLALLKVLDSMGCTLENAEAGIRLTGPSDGHLKGIDVDMHAFSDQALTLAAIAPFAGSPVCIRNVGHIRLQECDRCAAITDALSRMGIRAEVSGDDITIWPGDPAPARIRTFGDHRVAMAFALTGLRAPGIIIEDPACCRKTFENYFDVLDGLCVRIR